MSQSYSLPLQAGSKDAAIYYARHGISVIPIVSGKKSVEKTVLEQSLGQSNGASWKRFQTKIADTELLDSWFENPQTNIGILAAYQGTLILDFDEHDAFECWKAHYKDIFDKTAVQKSAKGYHVFLKLRPSFIRRILWNCNYFYSNFYIESYSSKNVVGQILWKGSYAVAWPSRLENGTFYSWLPGHSPSENKFTTIRSLKSIGIIPENPIKKKIGEIVQNCFRDPIKNVSYCYMLYLRARGKKGEYFPVIDQRVRDNLKRVFKFS